MLALAVSRVVLALVGAWKGRLATRIGAALTAELRGRLVERLQQLAVSHYDRHQVGSLMSRVAYDSEVLHGLVHQITAGFLLQILQVVGVGIMLLVINPKLALFTLIPVPLVIGSRGSSGAASTRVTIATGTRHPSRSRHLSSMLAGIRVVKAFAQEPREYGRFQRASEYHADVASVGRGIGHDVCGLDADCLQSRRPDRLVRRRPRRDRQVDDAGFADRLPGLPGHVLCAPGDAVEFHDLADQFSDRLPSGCWNCSTRRSRCASRHDRRTRAHRGARSCSTTCISATIRTSRCSRAFRLRCNRARWSASSAAAARARRHWSTCWAGSTTWMTDTCWWTASTCVSTPVHSCGSGSASCFRKPICSAARSGTISRTDSRKPRSSKGWLPPRRRAPTTSSCARRWGTTRRWANSGAGLSGGERQRLSLARALLYDPPILVLDEATSNIDTEAERMIQQALVRLTTGRTTIAIAHRLSTLRNADRILVFDRGRLAEEGTHEQLLADNGIYARMVAIQTQLTRDANVDKLSDEVDQSAKLPSATDGSQGGQVAKSSSKPADHSLRPAPASSANRDRPSMHPPAADQEMPWLAPATAHFTQGPLSTLQLSVAGQEPVDGVFVVCAFPTNAMDRYLSLRIWEADGDDREIGMIRDLAEWPQLQRELVEERVRRRYLFRRISAINSLDLHHGHLWFDVQTDLGQQQFCMRWSQSQAIEFGQHGKLIYDTEDNQYVIADLQALSPADLELFRRFVYW